MAVLRAVLTMVGLLVVLLLAAAVVGLAVAILAIMVMQGVEGEKRRQVPAPVPARRPAPTRSLLMVPAILKIQIDLRRPVIPALATIPAKDTAREGRRGKGRGDVGYLHEGA